MIASSVILALCFAVGTQVLCLDISHLELEVGNGTCKESSCTSIADSSTNKSADLRSRNCMCDQKCIMYGDCCIDSPFFRSIEQRRAFSSFQCSKIAMKNGIDHIYMKTSCPPSWKNSDIRKKCEVSSTSDNSDPLLLNPVTGVKNSITYGNIFCAICHQNFDVQYWNSMLVCDSITYKNTTDSHKVESVVKKSLTYNSYLSKWQATYDGNTHNCEIRPSFPDSSELNIRACVPNIVRSCAIGWNNVEIRSRCEAYTSIVYNESDAYRNTHCAICNNVPVQKLSCSAVDTRISFGKVSPFSVLFEFSGGKTVGKVQPCKDSQLYDPFFKMCRDVLSEEMDDGGAETEKDREVRRTEAETPIVTATTNRTTNYSAILGKCPKFILNPADYDVSNKSSGIYIPAYGRTFTVGSFVLMENRSVVICADSVIGKTLVSKYKPYLGMLTAIGIGISILCLCLHLMAFFLVSELRNLSGMNLASFSFALLMAYICFWAGDSMKGRACFVNAVLTYYFFLASFFWMLAIAFDVWRALRIATSELRVTSGKQWKKFFIYSIWSWLLPAKLVVVSLLVEMSPKGVISDNFKPNFGTVSCWFGNGEAILIFLGIPACLVMILNVVFFTSSLFMIYSSHSMASYTANKDSKRNVSLFSRLAVIMGLAWITGLVAGFVDNEYLWVIFILLNTTQGLFIFVAFTCRSRVLKVITDIRRDSNTLHLPTFSCSAGSEDDSDKKRKQSKTSSTYY